MDLQAVIFDYGEVLSGPPDPGRIGSCWPSPGSRRSRSKKPIGPTAWITMPTF